MKTKENSLYNVSLTHDSDIGHESHWPETANLAWESNPGPIKNCTVWVGVQTFDLLK